jgi:nitrate reductase delta subunit
MDPDALSGGKEKEDCKKGAGALPRSPLAAFGALLTYPSEGYAERAAACARALERSWPEAAARIASFAGEATELGQAEELFTRTFDLNPACALEAGWHLYGEAYERGAFLVKARGLLRRYGVAESGELPDHLSLLLPLLDRMPEDEAAPFARACVTRAVAKMVAGFGEADNPYREVLSALLGVLVERFGDPEEEAPAPAWAAAPSRPANFLPGGLR